MFQFFSGFSFFAIVLVLASKKIEKTEKTAFGR